MPRPGNRRETPRDAEAESALHAAILACADACLAELVAARQREGAELAAVLSRHIDEIATLADRAERHPARDRAMLCGSPAMLASLTALLDARGFVVSPRIGTAGDYVIERAFVEK